MPKSIKTMFEGKAGYVGSNGKLKIDTLIFRTGIDMKRKTYSGIKSFQIKDLKFNRK